MVNKADFRIAFMGTPDFSVRALDALIDAGYNVVCVYSQPPKPAGRGHKIHKTVVHKRADELNIDVRHPKTLRTEEAAQDFADLNLDIAVVVAYGLILPQSILDAPKHGCLNIHASLLPRWRGAAPIQRAILAGDTETGICIMQMDAGLDTGDVLKRESTAITDETTSSSLHDILSVMGGGMIVDVVNDFAKGLDLQPTQQSEEGMTYAKMLSREDGKINWENSANDIERQIRALTPWPGVWLDYKGERMKLHKVEKISQTGKVGEILDKKLTIACGKDALRLLSVQPAGKKAMDGSSFLNGSPLAVGDCFQ